LETNSPSLHQTQGGSKARAVRAVFQLRKELGTDHGTVARVAEQADIGEESLRKWVRQAEIDGGLVPGVTSEQAARIRELEQENRELRRANSMAESSGERNDSCVSLRWCHVAEGLAWSVVQASLNSLEVSGRVNRQVGALGQVLAQEPVGVLVRPALPWRVCIAEIDRDPGRCREAGVPPTRSSS
jgi:transposase